MRLGRAIWCLCLAMGLAACEPNFVAVAVSGIDSSLANLEVNSEVGGKPYSVDRLLEEFAMRPDRDAPDWEYNASIEEEAKGKSYALSIAGLDKDGCTVRQGTATTNLQTGNGSPFLSLRVQLRPVVPRVCKLQIEKEGDLSLLDVMITTDPFMGDLASKCRKTASSVCRQKTGAAIPLPSGAEGASPDEEWKRCSTGCTCPQECKTQYRETDTATMTLRRIPGYRLSWAYCDGGQIDAQLNSCTVAMNQRRRVKISVEPVPASLTGDEGQPLPKIWGLTSGRP